MDDATLAALPYDPDARAKWVHDLRNAVNVLGIGTKVCQRLLEKGREEEARAALADGLEAWERCRDLLAHAPEATQLAGGLQPEAVDSEGDERRYS